LAAVQQRSISLRSTLGRSATILRSRCRSRTLVPVAFRASPCPATASRSHWTR